uniref:Uncharacterized protein n=1 Tax=viral metagenome TaxID=1070528 RepID=A0A6M3LI24_9ZZZZ
MFIKIRHSNVEKDENGVVIKSSLDAEHVYDCNHYALFPSKEPRGDADDGRTPEHPQGQPIGLEPTHQKTMNLMLEFNKSGPEGWDRTISFPCEGNNQCVEIFVMNEHGKTVDRMVY